MYYMVNDVLFATFMKWIIKKSHRALFRFAEQWPQSQAIQLVRECKAEVDLGSIGFRDAAQWLAGLAV